MPLRDKCIDCGNPTTGYNTKRCRKCWRRLQLLRPELHPRWKGGRFLSKGYVMVRLGNAKYAREHKLVMEQKLGRSLAPDEIVHHIDGNKSNNHPDNLTLTNNLEHNRYHVKATHCKLCGKEGQIVRGYCMFHYMRWLDHGLKGKGPPPDSYHGPCKVCGKKHYARQLCAKHYRHFREGKLKGTWKITRTPKSKSSYVRK